MPGKRYESETWWALLEHIERNLDPSRQYQAPIGVLVKAVGCDQRTLYRHIADAKRWGVLEVSRISTDFVAGRQPNIYTLNVHVDDLRARWSRFFGTNLEPPEVAEADRAKPAPEPVMSPIEQEVSADVAEAVRQVRSTVGTDIEVDGWLAGAD